MGSGCTVDSFCWSSEDGQEAVEAVVGVDGEVATPMWIAGGDVCDDAGDVEEVIRAEAAEESWGMDGNSDA